MMRKALLTLGCLAAVAIGPRALAAAPYLGVVPQGNPQAASSIVHGTCAACHGADGNSVSPAIPNLAGQNYNYLLKQLEDFRSGARNVLPMSILIKTVPQAQGDQNIRNLASYFSEQKLKRGKSASGAAATITNITAEQGYKIFEQGIRAEKVPACAACHGASGVGMAPMAVPALDGQRAAYVLQQLKQFADGQRHNSPHHVMAVIAARLKKAQMTAVADYVSLMEPALMLGTGPKTYAAYIKNSATLPVPGIPAAALRGAKAAH